MAAITIHTGLPHFRMIDQIIEVTQDSITGRTHFDRAASFLGIEALAQLGALHVRYLNNFERHVMVLSLPWMQIETNHVLNGNFNLSGRLKSSSTSAFAYELSGSDDKTGNVALKGEFNFAAVPYNRQFNENNLKQHYQEVFRCLQNAAEKD